MKNGEVFSLPPDRPNQQTFVYSPEVAGRRLSTRCHVSTSAHYGGRSYDKHIRSCFPIWSLLTNLFIRKHKDNVLSVLMNNKVTS